MNKEVIIRVRDDREITVPNTRIYNIHNGIDCYYFSTKEDKERDPHNDGSRFFIVKPTDIKYIIKGKADRDLIILM